MRTFPRLVPAIAILVPAFLLLAAPSHPETACTMDAKLCPDGVTYVGRDGNNNCEWQKCPGEEGVNCAPYVCANGTTHPRCSDDGHIINYFAEPCHMDGGEEGAPFTDVTAAHPNADAIFYVKAQGIVEGYADGTFKPNAVINRAEFTKIIVGASFEPGDADCGQTWGSERGMGSPFVDVRGSDWFSNPVCRAYMEGVVTGYGNGLFKPAAQINFVEAAKILALSFDIAAPGMAQDDAWYKPYVTSLERANAIPTSITGLDQAITRGEMAEMIYRLKAGVAEKESQTYEGLISGSAETMFKVYFYTQRDLDGATYEAEFAVVRRVPHTSAVADAALKALFAGPTPKEYSAGARTSADVSSLADDYRGVTIHAMYADPLGGEILQNVAIVDFGEDAFDVLNGAAARQFMAKSAIEATLKEFPTIQHVLYSKDGEVWTMWDA